MIGAKKKQILIICCICVIATWLGGTFIYYRYRLTHLGPVMVEYEAGPIKSIVLPIGFYVSHVSQRVLLARDCGGRQLDVAIAATNSSLDKLLRSHIEIKDAESNPSDITYERTEVIEVSGVEYVIGYGASPATFVVAAAKKNGLVIVGAGRWSKSDIIEVLYGITWSVHGEPVSDTSPANKAGKLAPAN